MHIAFNDDTYSEAGIHIYDVTGRDVISIPRVAASLIDIDVHALCAGDYTLTCVKDGTRVQRHFIVVR